MELPLLLPVALLIGALAIGLGIAFGRFVWPSARQTDSETLATAQTQIARLDQQCTELRNRADQLAVEYKTASDSAQQAGEEVARLTERVAGLTKQIEDQVNQNRSLQTQRDALASESKEATAEVARLKERESSLTHQLEAQVAQIANLRQQRDGLAGAAKDAAAEVARLRERESGLTQELEARVARLSKLQVERDAFATESGDAAAEVARLKERENSLMQQVEGQVAQLASLQQQLTVEFENIATRILRSNASELSETSQKALNSILAPLRERIQDFQKRVETTYEAENREVLSLKEQIKIVIETSHTIGNQADGLAKALRGDSQLLGRWGELALERILEAAGLTEGREYVSQGRGLGLKSESGGSQKPDVIIMLPEQRTMIIDSKISLASYERLIAATDKAGSEVCAGQLVRDMKGHIDGLAGKRYQENNTLQAHDCVLMFVPLEGALAAALTNDAELFLYAWDRHVVLVGPSTLLMTLRTVASIWRYELQGQNAQEIAHLAGDLCDKVSSSLGDLNCVTEKIRGALEAHNEAVKRLATGKGNALSIGIRMRGLGVKPKRTMPKVLIDGVSIDAKDETPMDEVEDAVVVA